MSFAHMKRLIESKGGTTRQAKVNDGRVLMKNQFITDVSYRDSFYYWKFGVEDNSLENVPIKIFENKYSSANGFTVKFHTTFDTPIVVGDMLYDKEKDLFWLCVESYDNDDILCSGKLVRCVNNKMRWQDNKGNICEYPVFEINSTQYNSGESGNKIVQVGSSQHIITIVADENTIKLDHGQRFFWDRNEQNPTVFKVTQNDTTAMNFDKGLLKVTVTEDQYNPDTDSIDLWLCDYKDPKSREIDNVIQILYSGEPNIRIGRSKTFSVANNANAEFSTQVPQMFVDLITLDQINEYMCKITTENTPILVGSSFKLIANDKNGNQDEVLIKIQGGV